MRNLLSRIFLRESSVSASEFNASNVFQCESMFLSSSLVLQVSQTHLVNKGEYSFFRESISTFQPIVLRQGIS